MFFYLEKKKKKEALIEKGHFFGVFNQKGVLDNVKQLYTQLPFYPSSLTDIIF